MQPISSGLARIGKKSLQQLPEQSNGVGRGPNSKTTIPSGTWQLVVKLRKKSDPQQKEDINWQ